MEASEGIQGSKVQSLDLKTALAPAPRPTIFLGLPVHTPGDSQGGAGAAPQLWDMHSSPLQSGSAISAYCESVPFIRF